MSYNPSSDPVYRQAPVSALPCRRLTPTGSVLNVLQQQDQYHGNIAQQDESERVNDLPVTLGENGKTNPLIGTRDFILPTDTILNHSSKSLAAIRFTNTAIHQATPSSAHVSVYPASPLSNGNTRYPYPSLYTLPKSSYAAPGLQQYPVSFNSNFSKTPCSLSGQHIPYYPNIQQPYERMGGYYSSCGAINSHTPTRNMRVTTPGYSTSIPSTCMIAPPHIQPTIPLRSATECYETYPGYRRQPPIERKMLCVEEMKQLAKHKNNQMILGPRKQAPDTVVLRQTKCRFPDWKFEDDLYRELTDTTTDCNEWDPCPDTFQPVIPMRQKIYRRKAQVDDFDITIKDLFPWLSNFFDSCCCTEKEHSHIITRKVNGKRMTRSGAHVETVCLDCGNVLAQRPISKKLLRLSPNKYSNIQMTDSPMIHSELKKPVRLFDGYKEWEVINSDTDPLGKNGSKIPLPSFPQGPTRCFRKIPGQLPYTDTAYFDTDKTGRVVLPVFEEPTKDDK